MSKMVPCHIRLLDGTDYKLDIDKKMTGQELVDKICQKVSILERDYFGCTFVEKDIKFWLASKEKVTKQVKHEPYSFAFEVKFYPPDPTALREELTRYQVFLQLRNDILKERLQCSFLTSALLGSYAVQSLVGDHNPDIHGVGSEYIKSIQFARGQTDELLEKIAELHVTQRGQSPGEAEMFFLDNAKNVALYGVHLHDAKVVESNDRVSVGVCAPGLIIYKDGLRICRYLWPRIIKIKYNRSSFFIKLRTPDDQKEKLHSIEYKLADLTMARRLWRIAVEHHTFFRIQNPEPQEKGKFSKEKYRYSGRTYYQAMLAAQQIHRLGQEFTRVGGAGTYYGTSNGGTTLAYSTERKEETITEGAEQVTRIVVNQNSNNTMDRYYQDEPVMPRTQFVPPPPRGRAPSSSFSTGTEETFPQRGPGSTDGHLNQSYSRQMSGGEVGQGREFAGSPANQGYDNMGNDVHGSRYGELDEDGYTTVRLQPIGAGNDYNGRHTPNWDPRGGASHRSGSVTSGGNRSQGRGVDDPRQIQVDQYGNVIYTASSPVRRSTSPMDEDGAYDNRGQYSEPYYDNRSVDDNWSPTSSVMVRPTTRTYVDPDGIVVTEYRTERNGVIETHVEKRMRVVDEYNTDHDRLLAEAIRNVTGMDSDLSVQKIEIQTDA